MSAIPINKIDRIQVLRGIAMCAVISIHTNARGLAGVLIRPHVNFSVALFIFLSGFLTRLSYADWRQFFMRRIGKVLIPYIFWTSLYTLINGGMLWKNLLTGEAAAPLYFVLVYIQFVLLTPWIGKLLQSRFRWVGYE